jgi:CDP-diacylglycerol--serine O-phosphatidyltransferase
MEGGRVSTRSSPAAFVHPANLLTYASLLAGLCAAGAARNGDAGSTAAWLAVAAIADTFDGRFARRFDRSAELQRVGIELDSLADAVTFGAVPVVCAMFLMSDATPMLRTLWPAASLAYVVCALTRLGFYNISHERGAGFVGLPSPAAALIWASAFVLGVTATAAALLAVLVGAAMIAPIHVPRPSGVGLALFVAWPAAIVWFGWGG